MPTIDIGALVDPGYSIKDCSGTRRPTIATVRQLDFRMVPENDPHELELYFSGLNHEINLTEYRNGINDLLHMIVKDGIKFPDQLKMERPFSTPLSLKHNRYCYIVYVLSDRNWQFAYNREGFSIGDADLTPRIYCESRRVGPDGKPVAGKVEKFDCKVAYFIADGAQAVLDNPRRYVHALNLHVDLIFRDSEGYPSYMPMIIDPDIRHPGGSGV